MLAASRDYIDVKLEPTSSVHSPVKSMTSSSYTSSPAPSTSSTPDYSQQHQFNLEMTSQSSFAYPPPAPSFDDVTMVRRNLIDGLSGADATAASKKSFENVTDKELRKKLKNRESAQAARDRKKAKMLALERQIAELLDRNRAVEAENRELRATLQRMEWRKDDVTYHHDATYAMTSTQGCDVIDYPPPYQQQGYSTQGSPDSAEQFFDFAPPYAQWGGDDVTNDARHGFVITSSFPGEHGVAG